jgi:hypothetical protein
MGHPVDVRYGDMHQWRVRWLDDVRCELPDERFWPEQLWGRR